MKSPKRGVLRLLFPYATGLLKHMPRSEDRRASARMTLIALCADLHSSGPAAADDVLYE